MKKNLILILLVIWNIIITYILIDNSDYIISKPYSNDTASRVYYMPNGNPSGVKSKLEIFAQPYKVGNKDYSGLNILVYNDTIHIGSNSSGNLKNQRLIIGGIYHGSKLDKSSDRIEISPEGKLIIIQNSNTNPSMPSR